MTVCTTCEKPTPDGVTLCHDDTARLEQDLAELDSVWEDLQTTVARLDRGAASVGGGGGGGSRPPVNLDALDKAQQLRVVLTGWAQLLPGLRPTGEPPAVASWLLSRVREIRKQDWAGDLQTELRDALNACRLATDRAAERIRLGPCADGAAGFPCQGTMTAIKGASTGRCRTCGATCDVREWQQWMIREAWAASGALPVILRALKEYGLRITPKDAENWAARGKLLACLHEDGSKTYQARQVHRVATEMHQKRAERLARAAEARAAREALESVA